jgi:cytochrome c2
MKTVIAAGVSAGVLLALSTPVLAADASHGQQLFRAQCGVCHQGGDGDGDGGQGPSLRGVIGRKIGGDADFAYSQPLNDAKDKWTQDTLAAFIGDPQKAFPGTAMPIKVGNADDRTDIAAYLATLKPAP